jgi:uncharacterized protein (TIGR00255 family)
MRVAENKDIFESARHDETDAGTIWEELESMLAAVLTSFNDMRAEEGAKLYADMSARVAACERLCGEIGMESQNSVNNYYDAFRERLAELTQGVQIDEQRIISEAAVYADKTCVTEELVRFASHTAQFTEVCAAAGFAPVGRKLDFIMQEMLRETNTIGSKSGSLDVTKRVIEIKSELEKIREQVQNVE